MPRKWNNLDVTEIPMSSFMILQPKVWC